MYREKEQQSRETKRGSRQIVSVFSPTAQFDTNRKSRSEWCKAKNCLSRAPTHCCKAAGSGAYVGYSILQQPLGPLLPPLLRRGTASRETQKKERKKLHLIISSDVQTWLTTASSQAVSKSRILPREAPSPCQGKGATSCKNWWRLNSLFLPHSYHNSYR